MSGARLTAGLECANDVGVRFTLWPSGDSQGPSRVSTGGAVSCASVARTAGAARAAPPGTASPLRRPWCNRNAASDMRNRWRAHRNGDAVHKPPDVDVHARHATDARRPGVKIRPLEAGSSARREPVDRRSGPRGPEQVLQLDDPLEAALQPAMLLDHRVVHAADRLLDPVDLAAGRAAGFAGGGAGGGGGIGLFPEDRPCPSEFPGGADDGHDLDGSALALERVPEAAVRAAPRAPPAV